jgi:hypothetical protein
MANIGEFNSLPSQRTNNGIERRALIAQPAWRQGYGAAHVMRIFAGTN